MKISPTTSVLLSLLAHATGVADGAKPFTEKSSVTGLTVFMDFFSVNETTCQSKEGFFFAGESKAKVGGAPTSTSFATLYVFTGNFCTGSGVSSILVSIEDASVKGNIVKGVTVRGAITNATVCRFDEFGDPACEVATMDKVLFVSFTPNGTPEMKRVITVTSTLGYRSKTDVSGSTVDATVSFTGTTLDGIPPESGFGSGFITKSATGTFTTNTLI